MRSASRRQGGHTFDKHREHGVQPAPCLDISLILCHQVLQRQDLLWLGAACWLVSTRSWFMHEQGSFEFDIEVLSSNSTPLAGQLMAQAC